MKTSCLFGLLCMWALALPSQPLFQRMSAGSTGVDFENTLVDRPEHNILIYSNYYGGAGVGIGDFNRDGWPDLFFAGNLVADRLYLNLGEWKFEDQTEAAGIQDDGGWSSGVAVADVNGDGWLDIYVTRELYDDQPELRRNRLYLNQRANGVPQFVEAAASYGIDDSARTRHATFLDYDRDGDLDLFLLNQPPNPGNYSPYLGENLTKEAYRPRLYRHDGTHFTDVSREAGVLEPGFANSVGVADLNDDGWPDLYLANDFDAPDRLYLNQKNGRFQNVINRSMRHISFYSMGVDIADINNDGLPDISVLDMVAKDNFRNKANMSGMNPEAFWEVVKSDGHYQYMYNTLQLNRGLGFFSDIGQLAGVANTDWSWSNLLADFDNDGFKDLYITNGLLRDIRNKDSEKEFARYVTEVINAYILKHPNEPNIIIWDVLDLDEALSRIPSVKLANYVFQNRDGYRFADRSSDWGLDDKAFSHGAAYADLDLDGDLDLVVSNVNEPAFLYQNLANAQTDHHWLRLRIPPNMIPAGAKARLRCGGQDQWQELNYARGMYSTSETVFHFGLGTCTDIEEVEITWPDGRYSRLQNIKPDQVIALTPPTTSVVTAGMDLQAQVFQMTDLPGLTLTHRENRFDDFAREVLLPHRMSTLGPRIAVADVDGDGREDVFQGGSAGAEGMLLLQLSEGQFSPASSAPWRVHRPFEDIDICWFDADGDADLDLYIVTGGNEYSLASGAYKDRLYLNLGEGRFQHAFSALPNLASSGSCVRPADVDGDGDLDLFVGGRQVPGSWPAPASSQLLINVSTPDSVRFEESSAQFAPELQNLGLVTDATWTDYDRDGDPDLLVVGEWMSITLFRNEQGRLQPVHLPLSVDAEARELASLQSLSECTGWWYGLTAADMDGDGDEDYVIGNLGENYKYQATPQAPFQVYFDDFDGNGSRDIVLGYYDEATLYPLRGRQCSSEQIPELAEQFPTYSAFAQATLEEVYGKNELQEALHFEANTFASVYLENRGDQPWRVRKLPVEAQFSSVESILVEDIDQDGHLDLVLAGNLYWAEVETPRNDAGVGLWLKGDSQGNFVSIPPTKSGLYLPYDVQDLSWLRIKGKRYLLAALNNGPLKVLRIHP